MGFHITGGYKSAYLYHESNLSTPEFAFTQYSDGVSGKDYAFIPSKTGRYYVRFTGYSGGYANYSFILNY